MSISARCQSSTRNWSTRNCACQSQLLKIFAGGLTGGLNYYRAFGRYKLPSYYDNGIRVPTLIIWGLKDVALSRASAEASFKYIHDLKVHWIESTGHNTGQEDPDTVNEIMEDFLA